MAGNSCGARGSSRLIALAQNRDMKRRNTMLEVKILTRATMIGVVCLAFMAGFASAGSLDLSRYRLVNSFGAPRVESSAITYDWDSDSLFIVEDSARFFSQISKTGALISEMSLSGFRDTEGLSYMGNGKFVLVDERVQSLSVIGYIPAGTVVKSRVPSYFLGSKVKNDGIEGVSYDPSSGKFIAVKQKDPMKVIEATISFGQTTTGTQVDLFNPKSLGLNGLSDVQVLSMPWFAGTGFEQNILFLSAKSRRLVEADRAGKVLSSFDLSKLAPQAEGVTIDKDGIIYVAAEGSGPKVIMVLAPSGGLQPESQQ